MKDILDVIDFYLAVNRSQIKEDSKIEDLVFDSLDFLGAVIEIEGAYAVELEDEEFESIKTVKELFDFLILKGVDKRYLKLDE
jgi:acyl carrier protein